MHSFNFNNAVFTELTSKFFFIFSNLFMYFTLYRTFFLENPIACKKIRIGIFFLLSILANNSLYFMSLIHF